MWKWLFAAIAVLAVAVAFLPLRLVAPRVAPDLTATEISGSVWRGRLVGAQWRGVELGDLDVGLDPRALLGGRLRLDFARAASRLSGRIGTEGGIHRVERVDGELRLALPYDWAPAVDIALADVSLDVDGAGNCVSAAGNVATRLRGIPGIGDSPALRGTARCDGAALLLPLASDDGRLGLDVHVRADRRYRADLRVASGSMLVQMGLAAAGFVAGPDGATRTVEGTL